MRASVWLNLAAWVCSLYLMSFVSPACSRSGRAALLLPLFFQVGIADLLFISMASVDGDPPRRDADMVYGAALEAARVASLSMPAGLERTEAANHMLASFGAVTQSEGEPFTLCVEPLRGDGFCFFRGVAAQMNLPDENSIGVQRLAACAFGEVAQQEDRQLIDISAEELESIIQNTTPMLCALLLQSIPFHTRVDYLVESRLSIYC